MNKEYEVVKFIDNEIELDVNIDPREETIWLSTEEIAYLFAVNRPAITKHILNIYKDNELDESTCSILEQVQIEGEREIKRKIKYYNLDMIISVGYRVNSKRGIQFRKWANSVLKQYMLKGYVINENRTLVTNENYINLINKVESIDNRVISIEDKIRAKDIPLESIFYNGEVYDAYSLIQSIFSKANSKIIIIDNYVDRSVLDRLKYKGRGVNVEIYTNPNTSRLLGSMIDTFNNQYGGLNIKYTLSLHDRFIIIDNKHLYHLGASIKDAGKKMFAINEMEKYFIDDVINKVS